MIDPTQRLMPVVRLAPAKLNLTLAVVGRRPDGYHALHSIMVPLVLADRLSLAPAPAGADTLHVTGFPAGPVEENLVLRAIALTRAAVRQGWPGPSGPPSPLAIRLEKLIPVAAGLGGGSSDAAATIDGALDAWGADLDRDARSRLAVRLGSDVPFFLARGAASVEGRGETVTPLPHLLGQPPGVLLVTPSVPVETSDVFALFAAGVRPTDLGATTASSRHLAAELTAGATSEALISRAGVLASANDLIPAAARLMPELVPFRRSLMRLLARPVAQSGSGPTSWVLYPSLEEAATAAAEVREALAGGRLVAPGSSPPFVQATTLAWSPGGETDQGAAPPATHVETH